MWPPGHRESHQEESVNTYDPAEAILYVHMARETDPYAIPVENRRTCTRLPAGYSNTSARTRIRRPRMCR